jgi:nitrite reductase (NAD(P)H)
MSLTLFSPSDDSVQICSCHNVTKGDVVESVKNGTCKTMGEVKSCTKAGTGCGGCMPLVQSIFNKTMLEMGQEVSNHCEHSLLTLGSQHKY